MTILILLSSGLFLGWSMGANDAANIFGAAVGTKMLRFRFAAVVASIFMILGAILSGAGASETLGTLGSVNKITGAFVVVLSAAITAYSMTRSGLPVSISQSIVGAIIGWNLFAGLPTDIHVLTKIVGSWLSSLVLADLFAFIIYQLVVRLHLFVNIHLFRLDAYTRLGLIIVGAFGAYALGANNIANVMGVFVPITPFDDIHVGPVCFSSVQQLFLLGGIAIAVGIFSYSHRVMMTVGKSVFKLTPQTALIVILSESLVLFLFASKGLHDFLKGYGLPAFPLVPVSSSQLVVGAIIGIGIAKKARNIKYRVLGRIGMGWIITPLLSLLISYFSLFICENVLSHDVVDRTTLGFENGEMQIPEEIVAEIR